MRHLALAGSGYACARGFKPELARLLFPTLRLRQSASPTPWTRAGRRGSEQAGVNLSIVLLLVVAVARLIAILALGRSGAHGRVAVRRG